MLQTYYNTKLSCDKCNNKYMLGCQIVGTGGCGIIFRCPKCGTIYHSIIDLKIKLLHIVREIGHEQPVL